ncbi:MAG: PAAR domain-containing protein [Bacteroidota bacterium]
MGKKTATIKCHHTCPMKDGKKEHVGGPVIQGSQDVFVENKMLARHGDSLQCQSPKIDKIIATTTSVFVNGKLLARIQDPTIHGGKIVEGSSSVFAG